MIPIAPNSTKAHRHDIKAKSPTTSGGVNARPQRANIHMTPSRGCVHLAGSQFVNVLVRFGKQPASPAPKKKRIPQHGAEIPHEARRGGEGRPPDTTRINTLRGPI